MNNVPPTNTLELECSKDTTIPGNGIAPDFHFEEDIKKEVKEILKLGGTPEGKGLFLIKPASHWIEQAKSRPIPQMLFGEFWREGEVCILFADTNLGKSILAVQIGESISIGRQIPGFRLEAQQQPILYFDFELSDKQFEARYSQGFKDHYRFSQGFNRAEINPDADIVEGLAFDDYLNASLEQSIIDTGAKIVIIDNITYLRSEMERAKDALPLMKHLKALKNKHGLSILCLAHTPKRDLSKPLGRNDLQGSKMLINFCDSAFAIGESTKDKNIRYIKQIKARNTEVIYDRDNVCICQVVKPSNFLGFEFMNFGCEREHLKQQMEGDREDIIKKVKELHQQGKSQREIAREIGYSLGVVNKYLKL